MHMVTDAGTSTWTSTPSFLELELPWRREIGEIVWMNRDGLHDGHNVRHPFFSRCFRSEDTELQKFKAAGKLVGVHWSSLVTSPCRFARATPSAQALKL